MNILRLLIALCVACSPLALPPETPLVMPTADVDLDSLEEETPATQPDATPASTPPQDETTPAVSASPGPDAAPADPTP